MIRIQLWKGDEQIGTDKDTPNANEDTGVGEVADGVIDQMITDIHAGTYGRGAFKIEADHIDDRRVFLGSYYRADVRFPKQTEHVA